MQHIGPEPPWEGRGRYGRWENTAELWDGTLIWTWREPTIWEIKGQPPLGVIGDILVRAYLPKIQGLLNDSVLITNVSQAT